MSSSLLFSMLVKMDAGQAKAEMRAFTAEIEKAGNEGVAMAGKLARPTQQAVALGRSHDAAAGSVGNLVAQFNDIGMMIAAGQNPLQLAIQQGTQISQVIGPMGASGAVKALGSAFLGMLNPINFVTLAVIGGGAAFAQWAMSGEEAAGAVTEAMKAVGDAISDVETRLQMLITGETNSAIAKAMAQIGQLKGEIAVLEMLADQSDPNASVMLDADTSPLRAQIAEIEKLIKAYRDAADQKARLEDTAKASDMLADLQAEADLNAVIAEYGAQSTEATAKRAEQERAAYVEKVNSLDVSDQMRLSLIASYDAANALAGVDLTSGIANAANSAATLARNLGISVENAGKMLANGYQGKQPVVFDPRDPHYDAGAAFREQARQGVLNKPSIPSSSGPARASAGGATTKEADSVAKLIEKLQAEVDVSRELDPIQREMAQYRTQMAGATDAERQKVEALISQRLREKEVTESLEFVSKQSGDALIDALMGGADAGERLIDSLKRAALQALILGQGPLSGLLGGGLSAAFSLFSGPATGAFGLPFADGGMIYGAGGPRADQVPVMASAGEFIVNARATAQHRPLLERINNGAVPAFANGGIVGGGAAAVREGGSVTINIDARYAQQGVAEAIASAMQAMVPQIKLIAVGAVSDQMRRGRI